MPKPRSKRKQNKDIDADGYPGPIPGVYEKAERSPERKVKETKAERLDRSERMVLKLMEDSTNQFDNLRLSGKSRRAAAREVVESLIDQDGLDHLTEHHKDVLKEHLVKLQFEDT